MVKNFQLKFKFIDKVFIFDVNFEVMKGFEMEMKVVSNGVIVELVVSVFDVFKDVVS